MEIRSSAYPAADRFVQGTETRSGRTMTSRGRRGSFQGIAENRGRGIGGGSHDATGEALAERGEVPWRVALRESLEVGVSGGAASGVGGERGASRADGGDDVGVVTTDDDVEVVM